MTRTWTSNLVRVVASAAAGATLTFGTGQLALLLNGRCGVLCQPSVALTFGSLVGVIAFWNVGRE